MAAKKMRRSAEPHLHKTVRSKKRKLPANELLRQVESIVKNGTGIEKRVKAVEAMPSKYSRDDGVRYDPRWQDCIAG